MRYVCLLADCPECISLVLGAGHYNITNCDETISDTSSVPIVIHIQSQLGITQIGEALKLYHYSYSFTLQL